MLAAKAINRRRSPLRSVHAFAAGGGGAISVRE